MLIELMNYYFEPGEREKELYAGIVPAYRFTARNPKEWRYWAEKARPELIRILGMPEDPCDLEPELLERVELEDYIRERVVIRSERYAHVPAYVLIPKKCGGRLPAVIALHGHGPGKVIPAGIPRTDAEKKLITEGERDYGVQAVRNGYIAVIPDLRGFGETMNSADMKEGSRKPSSCREAFLHAVMFGRTLIGERVWDVRRLIDYLETRGDVDVGRIACVGQSGGGTVTLFAAAVETRIRAAVVSCYFCTFKHSIMAVHHCECNYIPGILRFGEMYDIAALIAPRSLLIVAGKEDSIFPIEGVEYAFERLRKAYDVAGVPDRLEKYIGEGGHRFYSARVWSWLGEQLIGMQRWG